MLPIRIKACSESDLRMLGDLARNIQRVLPVTQADIDAAAALGKEWTVWKVIEVSDPLDNLRGGTQLVIKQNSITPGQNVRRVLIVSGPGGETVVIGPGPSPLLLPDAIADSLSYVKAFGGTEQRNLPDNYIERQFIYMMDGSYIKVEDLPISAGYKVEFDFQTTSLSTNLRNYIGGRASGVSAGGGFRLSKLANSNQNRVVLYGFETGTEYYDPTTQFQANTRYKYTYNNGVCTLESGGSVVSTQTFTVTDNTSTKWGINAYVSGNDYWQTDSDGIYVYSLKVWNAQGELVMNLVPAVQRGTVPVVGFYDTVSGTFKTATAGTFAAGGEAVPTPDTPMDIICNNGVLKVRHESGLPLGYTKLEYIQSSGTQYIDTGIGLNSAYKYRLVVASVNGNNASNIWGYKSNASYTSGPLCMIGWTGSPTTYIGAYNKNGNITGAFPSINDLRWIAGTFFDILLDVTQSNFSVNDTNYYSTSGVSTALTTHSWTDTHHPYLFGTQTVDSAVPSSAIRVKAYQVRDTNGDLIQNFVPCKNASNVVGMYDTVSGQFFTNAGTGTFIAGDPVSDPVVVIADGTVETINAHGKNLFDEAEQDTQYYYGNDGSNQELERDGSKLVHSAKIPCKPNTTYVLSGQRTAVSVTAYYKFTFWDKNGNFISYVNNDPVGLESYVRTATTPNDCYYIAFNSYNTDINVQLEEGSTATTYQPYFNGGTATAEMLLKVGDYQDVQSIIDGVVTRKVGIKVLDGTEDWSQTDSYSNPWVFYTTFSDGKSGSGTLEKVYCTHFQGVAETNPNMPPESAKITVQGASPTISRFYVKTAAASTIELWKAYLAAQYAAGTPVIVVYPLATATTESVAGQTLQVQAGDNTLEITQASLNNLELECEYEKTV